MKTKRLISMSYPGAKNAAGIPQWIINQMPPHRIYVELFMGSGAILRHKRPAHLNIGVDINPKCRTHFADEKIAETFGLLVADSTKPKLELLTMDAFDFLREHQSLRGRDTLLYLDPPYLVNRNGGSRRAYYAHEMQTEDRHAELLELIATLPGMVMLSGYWSELYAERLRDWRAVQFTSSTRGGPAQEWLWMNYDEGTPPCRGK